MSAKLMGRVWELELPHNQQSVLLAYADHADDDGFNARPGIEYVAWKTGYSERQVQRIVRVLERDGLLAVTDPAAGRRATIYRVDVAAGVVKPPYVPRHERDREEPSRPDNLTAQQDRPDKVSPRHGGPARGDISGRSTDIQVSPEPEPSEEPLTTPPNPLLEDFEGWLAHHSATTGETPPRKGTAAWKKTLGLYGLCREDHTDDELLLTPEGAMSDPWRRENGYLDAQSCLRRTKAHKLIERGRKARAAGRRQSGGDWSAWVADHLSELEGAAADYAATIAQLLHGNGQEVTPEVVRARVKRRLEPAETAA